MSAKPPTATAPEWKRAGYKTLGAWKDATSPQKPAPVTAEDHERWAKGNDAAAKKAADRGDNENAARARKMADENRARANELRVKAGTAQPPKPQAKPAAKRPKMPTQCGNCRGFRIQTDPSGSYRKTEEFGRPSSFHASGYICGDCKADPAVIVPPKPTPFNTTPEIMRACTACQGRYKPASTFAPTCCRECGCHEAIWPDKHKAAAPAPAAEQSILDRLKADFRAKHGEDAHGKDLVSLTIVAQMEERAPKPISRAAFDAMTRADREAFCRSGGKLTK